MTLDPETLHLLQLIGGTLSGTAVFLGGAVKILLKQIDRRFEQQEKSREEGKRHWDEKFASLEAASGQWMRLEREFYQFKEFVSSNYLRREDWQRFSARIDMKQDNIGEKLTTLTARLERVIGDKE